MDKLILVILLWQPGKKQKQIGQSTVNKLSLKNCGLSAHSKWYTQITRIVFEFIILNKIVIVVAVVDCFILLSY